MQFQATARSIAVLTVGVLIVPSARQPGAAQVLSAPPAATAKSGGALPTKSLPKGFESYKDPQSTGRLIYVKAAGGPASAKAAMRLFLGSLNGIFDAAPDIKAATSDPNDTVLQALLSSKIAGQPVEAVATVATFQNNSIAGIMYDRSGSLRTSYTRLSRYFSKQIGQPIQTAQVSAEPNLSTWTQRSGGDHSANVFMPADWQLSSVKEGGAVLNGPNEEQVVLGYQTYVMPNTRGYAPYMAPEQALAWFLRNSGLRLVRMLQHDTVSRNGGGQQELMMVEVEQPNGSHYKAVCKVITAPLGTNVWQFHLTSMSAPEDHFDSAQPTMVAIWNNWKLDPAFVKAHMDHARETAARTRAMIMEGAQRSMHAFDNVNESIDQAIRGVSTMENTGTGKRAETLIGSERAVIDACKRNSMSCREVPINELLQ